MSQIPAGLIKQEDGSYSAPKGIKTAKQYERALYSHPDVVSAMVETLSPEFKKIGAMIPEKSNSLKMQASTDEAKLNKTERAYLAVLRANGSHLWIGVQNITLKLADDTRLTPDFSYVTKEGRMVFIDVKGFQREDALIKMKVAAREFLWAQFVIVKRESGIFGNWSERVLKP